MNIWQIATGESGRDYRELFTNHDIMILGPSNQHGNALENLDKYSDKPNSQNNQVWSFANKPEPGDRVLMRFQKEIIGIGQIPDGENNQYSFQDSFKCVYGWDLCHTRRVIWTDNNLIGDIKNVYQNIKQKPAFSGVNEPHICEIVEAIDESRFNRALKNLPSIDSTNYSDEELGRELFKKGISNKNIDDIIKALNQADRLITWYHAQDNQRPTEYEVVSHIILPIFLGLGWSHQQIAVEWKNVDMAFFKETPTKIDNCVAILEAKGLGYPLNDVLNQPIQYSKKLKLNRIKKIITTDGANTFVYQVKNKEVDPKPIGYISINNLQKEYILPKDINLVDTLVMLQPILS